MTWFNSSVTSGLESALNETALRGQTLSQNIANADTPNYKAKTVDFKKMLNHELQAHQSDPRHLNFSSAGEDASVVRKETGTAVNNNGNNVDMDREMANLAKTQVKYQALTEQMNSQFNRFHSVLRGGN